ncbi:MAG: hypothetical protein IIW63_02105 [Clostridia bacterium]|nr:hypothetical protein [Clostridia bacterium]
MKRSLRILSLVIAAMLMITALSAAAVYAAEEISDAIEESVAQNQDTPVADKVPDAAPVLPEAGVVADEETNITVADHIYGEEKILLVTMENLADTVYSVNVNVTYYGENGEVLGTEKQSYDQLEKGFPKNFIFRPGYDFVDYLLTIEKTAFEGETWRNDLIGEFGFTRWTYWDTENDLWQGLPRMFVTNSHESQLILNGVLTVIFDENGEIFQIIERYSECWQLPCNESYEHYGEYVYVPTDMMTSSLNSENGHWYPAPDFTFFTAYNVIQPQDSLYYDELVAGGYYTPGE